jgi:hypothetical protein
MVEKLVKGSDIVYSIVPVQESDISLVTSNKLYHQFVGYISVDIETGVYKFYSIEDNYKNAILNHWSINIVKDYDNYNYWFVIKDHPCKLYTILTHIYKGNYVCNVDNFDIWKSEQKNCLVGVVTHIEID